MGISSLTAVSVTMMDARRKSNYPQPPTMVPSPSADVINKKATINSPPPRPDLPIYTREEVAEHCDKDSLWYTFRGAVYDLTQFFEGHPGGAPVGRNSNEKYNGRSKQTETQKILIFLLYIFI
jgi:cytochrome b involved in lipid metabolism